MKIILQFLFVVVSVGAALAQSQQLVVPGALRNVEGNSSSGDLFKTTESIFQQVFSASEFASLGAAPPLRIDGDGAKEK